MRILSSLLICSLFTLPLAVTACGGGDDGPDIDPFDTFLECYMEHHMTEGLTGPHAITTCCLDHPIAGMAQGAYCGTTEATCESTITPNLTGTDATAADITSACTDYINQR
jgi:hypothetical protein